MKKRWVDACCATDLRLNFGIRTTGEPEYTTDSTLTCPDCGEEVHVGTGGVKNLDTHRTSSKCKALCERRARSWRKQQQRPDGSLLTFFAPRQTLVPSTVTAPPSVQAPQVHASASTSQTSMDVNSPVASDAASVATDSATPPAISCGLAIKLLQQLRDRMENIPHTIPPMIAHHLKVMEPQFPSRASWPLTKRQL